MLVLLGWALRRFGPCLRHRAEDGEDVLSGEQLLAQLSWTRFVTALGAVVGTGGAAMVLVTMAAIFFGPRDRIGTLVILTCFLLILIAGCVWAWLYIGRYGTHGILPVRTEPANPLRSPEVPVEAGAAMPVTMPARPAPVMAEEHHDEVVPEPTFVAPEPEVAVEDVPDVVEQEPEPSAAPVEEAPAAERVTPHSKDDVVVNNIEAADGATTVNGQDEGGPGSENRLVPDSAQEADGAEAVSEDDDGQEFVDIVERTAPSAEESGRAEALRRLHMRRNARTFSNEH